MAASYAMLIVLVVGCMSLGAKAKSMRGFESDVVRKLASSGPKCWSWCDHGQCSWSWGGCQCACEENYIGKCCDEMIQCGPEKDACPQDMLTPKTALVSSLLDSNMKFRSDVGPRVQTQGPGALQGIFWIAHHLNDTFQRGDSACLASFAKSYDGDNMSQGELREGDDTISIRVAGDRSWSFGDSNRSFWSVESSGLNSKFAEYYDLVYHFRLMNGSLANPIAFRIIAEHRNQGAKHEGWLSEFLVDWRMYKMTEQDATAAGFPGSTVWERVSFTLGGWLPTSRDLLVQIVDGESNTIQPAYSQWVAHQNSSSSNPGQIYYHEALTNDASL